MNPSVQTVFAALFVAVFAAEGFAAHGHEKHGTGSTPGSEPRHAHGSEHGHGGAAAGSPAKSGRTIKVKAMDIRYDSPQFEVKAGETIRFVVTNSGKMRHEFMIGDRVAQSEHAEMMKQMPDMVHEDANTITLEPGETKSLVWQFMKPGELEVACHIPGHYEAGMKSAVRVVH